MKALEKGNPDKMITGHLGQSCRVEIFPEIDYFATSIDVCIRNLDEMIGNLALT